jgi:CheY-like chemotaxis protein
MSPEDLWSRMAGPSGQSQASNGSASQGQSAPPVEANAAATRCVMVVDDNADAAESLALLLEAEGHRVVVEYDGRGAIEKARTHMPDVFLLDIGLPGMDGFELARELRKFPQADDAVFIALTGYGQEDDRKRSHDAGFDHHLVKPVEPSALVDLLASLDAR